MQVIVDIEKGEWLVMRRSLTFVLALFLVALLVSAPAYAQEQGQAGNEDTGQDQQNGGLLGPPNLEPMDMTFLNTNPDLQQIGDNQFGGPEDITSVTMDEGSPQLSTNWNPSSALYDTDVQAPDVTWTLEREGEQVGSTTTEGAQTNETGTGAAGDQFGTQAMPNFQDTNDRRSGTTPAWHPGNYTVGNHSVRRVEYQSRANPAVSPERQTVGSGTAAVTIFDTTPPKIEVGLIQPASGVNGLVSIGEAEQDGVDAPVEGTGHRAVLLATGNGFSEDMNTVYNSAQQSIDSGLVLLPELNEPLNIGEKMDGSSTVNPATPDPTAFGFHVFEDSPLKVKIKVTDNFTQYDNAMYFEWALDDADIDDPENGEIFARGTSETAAATEDGFYEITIDAPFNEPNYPTRVAEPDESAADGGSQRNYYLDIWAEDENHDCWQNGVANMAKVRIPIYVHDITPACEGTDGLKVRFHGRDIDDTIIITEDPVDHDIAGGAKQIKFAVAGAHLVNEAPFDAEFSQQITRPDPAEGVLTSATHYKLVEIPNTGLREALIIPEKTRLQFDIKAIDNYTVEKFFEVTDEGYVGPDVDDEPLLSWGVRGMESLDPNAENSPTMVNFQVANYREGVGFISHVSYRYTFFMKSRDKVGNSISFELPIYVLDTKYQVQHIMERPNKY